VNKLSAALPKCKIEWDGGVIEPKASGDADRRAAEWALQVGGRLLLSEEGKSAWLDKAELPRGPFVVEGIAANANLKPSDEALKKLMNLQGLHLRYTPLQDEGLDKLKAIRTLELLDVTGTQVTADGIANFQKALPKCKIQWDGKNDK